MCLSKDRIYNFLQQYVIQNNGTSLSTGYQLKYQFEMILFNISLSYITLVLLVPRNTCTLSLKHWYVFIKLWNNRKTIDVTFLVIQLVRTHWKSNIQTYTPFIGIRARQGQEDEIENYLWRLSSTEKTSSSSLVQRANSENSLNTLRKHQ